MFDFGVSKRRDFPDQRRHCHRYATVDWRGRDRRLKHTRACRDCRCPFEQAHAAGRMAVNRAVGTQFLPEPDHDATRQRSCRQDQAQPTVDILAEIGKNGLTTYFKADRSDDRRFRGRGIERVHRQRQQNDQEQAWPDPCASTPAIHHRRFNPLGARRCPTPVSHAAVVRPSLPECSGSRS